LKNQPGFYTGTKNVNLIEHRRNSGLETRVELESAGFRKGILGTKHGQLATVPQPTEHLRISPRRTMPASFRRGVTLLTALLIVQPAFCNGNSDSSSNEDSFHWKKAIAESFLALSLANIERVTTQEDTRDAIRGPFWENYVDSIENLHGFNDGDGFLTSYVVHPMEGAFAGFIERENDPLYRDVEFGKSQRYWISCMRSFAFSSVYSTVWSATIFGEPGIGYVEEHNKPGLVDLIATQTLGFAWMVGEDALDRYVVKRVERHVRNPYVRALTRSMLNPMRSYANILAFRKPWDRDSRPGVYTYKPGFDRDETGPKFSARAWPDKAAFELEAEPIGQHYFGSKGSNCLGGGGVGVIQLSHAELAFNIGGCELYGLPEHVTGDALNYTVGRRWRFLTKKWGPFLEVFTGGTKLTHVMTDTEKELTSNVQATKGHQPPADYASNHTEVDTNGATVIANFGVSYRISNAFSWRVGTLGYQRSWMVSRLQGFDYNQDLRLTTGISVTLGPWRQ
jgi:hypothetical protein